MAHRQYGVVLAPAAQRQLEKLNTEIQRRIVRALHRLEVEPRPAGVEPLSGGHDNRLWRVRVGDYRVVYEINDDELLVLVIRIGHRREVYRLR